MAADPVGDRAEDRSADEHADQDGSGYQARPQGVEGECGRDEAEGDAHHAEQIAVAEGAAHGDHHDPAVEGTDGRVVERRGPAGG